MKVIVGDAFAETLRLAREGAQVDCTVTSPPYFALRDYEEKDGQLGGGSVGGYLDYMGHLAFALRDLTTSTGTLWLNVGDTFNAYNHNRGPGTGFSASRHNERPKAPRGLTDPSLPNKSMLGIPWRVAERFQGQGWVLRNVIAWQKPSPSPEKVKDRFVRSYEPVFLFSKKDRYWFDQCIQEGERRPLDVWTIPTTRIAGHPAPFPVELASRCIRHGCPPGGIVFDPFLGSGTTGVAAKALGREFIGVELSDKYAAQAEKRINA